MSDPPFVTTIFAVLSTVINCSSPSSPVPHNTIPAQNAIVAPDDKCHILRCSGNINDDGCPDVILLFDSGSSTLGSHNDRWIREAREDIKRLPTLTKLQIRGFRDASEPPPLALERAMVVRDRLVSLGADPRVLEAIGDGSSANGRDVYFVVDCGPEKGNRE